MGVLVLTPAQEAIIAWRDPGPQDAKEGAREAGALPGLANLGNTCFANSVLQCLLNTPGWFPEACLAFGHFEGSARSQAALGRSFQSLARAYGSASGGALQRSNPALRNLKEAIAAIDPRYAGCQQQDAYEFLGCVLESLEEGFGALFHGEGPAPGPKADVIRAICGVGMYTTRTCHRCSTRFEVDHVTDTALRLPLLSPEAQFDARLREREEQTPVALQELLEASRRPETIEGYDCDECRRRSALAGAEHSRSTITQHGGVISATRDVVIVVLYRFAQTLDASGSFRPRKVTRKVSFPTELSLETGSYSLFGVVSHLGATLSAGHYVAAVRSRRDDMWYECNDETVKPLSVKALYGGRPITAVRDGAEPYILFYHRRADAAAPEREVARAETADEVLGPERPAEPSSLEPEAGAGWEQRAPAPEAADATRQAPALGPTEAQVPSGVSADGICAPGPLGSGTARGAQPRLGLAEPRVAAEDVALKAPAGPLLRALRRGCELLAEWTPTAGGSGAASCTEAIFFGGPPDAPW